MVIFGFSAKNDAERRGRELWGISLDRVLDPFDFLCFRKILAVNSTSSRPPPGTSWDSLGPFPAPLGLPGLCRPPGVGGHAQTMRASPDLGGRDEKFVNSWGSKAKSKKSRFF